MLDPRELLSNSWAYRGFQRMARGGREKTGWADQFLHVRPGDRVLDIGCGPADILDQLPEGVDYHGFDFEPRYIETARRKYGPRGTFEVRAVSPGAVADIGAFDVVMAIGVIHHLTDAEADMLFAGAAKVLRPGGSLFTLDGAYVDGQNSFARLMLKMDRGRFVRTPDAYLELARRHFREVHPTVQHDLLAMPYTHVTLEARGPVSA